MVTILAAILDGFYRKFSFIELAGIETKPYVFFLEIKTILYLNFAVWVLSLSVFRTKKAITTRIISYVRYIKLLTVLRGFLVIFLYLVWFSFCPSLFWEFRDNGVLKNLQF